MLLLGFVRQKDRVGRKGYRTEYQASHRFAVTQGVSSIGCLEGLKEFFGVGRIHHNRRHDNHKEHLAQYLVDRRVDLLETVIPFFRQQPLQTVKQRDFVKFAYCVELVAAGRHLTPEGLIEIAEITQTMNHKKSRQDMIRILRGHTPDIRDIG
jgi:LAGLIDADG endonuclease